MLHLQIEELAEYEDICINQQRSIDALNVALGSDLEVGKKSSKKREKTEFAIFCEVSKKMLFFFLSLGQKMGSYSGMLCLVLCITGYKTEEQRL